DDEPFGIDEDPLLFDLGRLGRVGFHGGPIRKYSSGAGYTQGVPAGQAKWPILLHLVDAVS
ncbi:MAG: hypothetical protein ACXWLW_12475, partial [Rhizomicrobium sp.]